TGAASGVGLATAERIAEEGGTLALMDINEDGIKKVAQNLGEKFGVKTFAYRLDVSNGAQVKEVIDQAAKDLDGFDTLLHIAGILRTYHTHEMTYEQWHQIINVNLHGTFYVCHASLPYLLANRHSAIVNMSSTSAIGSHPWMSAYAASKGGVISFTRALYIEYVKRGL